MVIMEAMTSIRLSAAARSFFFALSAFCDLADLEGVSVGFAVFFGAVFFTGLDAAFALTLSAVYSFSASTLSTFFAPLDTFFAIFLSISPP